ncbi:methionine--tRNA ligase [Abyssibacter sp.]|uniref:methionine--tRNA ligase n=1 Tax=Abyssibacter sp. TaxID=2320200 RepID=UPI0025B980DE|nr:methionine--tRNA ligase [Abyssibacter sp.]MCK5860266.1 methionine--tRNA ligase [Abyssibacter sp.]
MSRTLFVTSALPYANGPIHLGHMVEHVQSDTWVRYQRMAGNTVTYCCADDAHGSGIMLKAEAEGVTPEQLIGRFKDEHLRDFVDFGVKYDNYHSTHSDENRELSSLIYRRLRDAGLIESRAVEQAFDTKRGMFLPDRFIKGSCPTCKTPDQYGDNCEACGATYRPTDLINPISVVSGEAPVQKSSEHFFFRLPAMEAYLKDFLQSGVVQDSVAPKLAEWFKAGLKDWDISRDAPYFGFEIPDAPGKYFYVWVDAPVGYMASLKHLAARDPNLDFDAIWAKDSQAEVYHFIGKDIIYFHALFWPAMLEAAGFRSPTGVFAHGMITLNGEKMSKSRGTFITARTWLDHLPAEPLRYFYASRITGSIEDMDLGLQDFVQIVNADLVGKYVNIASRTANFISKRFGGVLGTSVDTAVLEQVSGVADDIADAYEARNFAKATRLTMAAADVVNGYIAEQQPWVIAKDEARTDDLQRVCTTALTAFRDLSAYLKPVLPQMALQVEAFLNIEPLHWGSIGQSLAGQRINKFKPLMTRIEDKQIEAMQAAAKAMADAAKTPAPSKPQDDDMISIDDFMKVDLRVARVAEANPVEGADKLLQLTLDVGELGTRNVFAGIKSAYAPEDLVGKLVVVVANLAPRKMRFGLSEGMVIAAGNGEGIYVVSPDNGATPGSRVK